MRSCDMTIALKDNKPKQLGTTEIESRGPYANSSPQLVFKSGLRYYYYYFQAECCGLSYITLGIVHTLVLVVIV